MITWMEEHRGERNTSVAGRGRHDDSMNEGTPGENEYKRGVEGVLPVHMHASKRLRARAEIAVEK